MSRPEREFLPGEGPAAKVSVSLQAGNIRAIKERVGARGLSAYVDATVKRQIERDLLEEALQATNDNHSAQELSAMHQPCTPDVPATPDLKGFTGIHREHRRSMEPIAGQSGDGGDGRRVACAAC
jgi:hypothetical protein